MLFLILNVAREKGQDAFYKVEVIELNIKITNYAKENGKLPQSLNDLALSSKTRKDIANKVTYSVGKNGLYSVCAPQNFGKDSSKKYCVGNDGTSGSALKNISFLPKYGGVKKTQKQLKADQEFVSGALKEAGSRKAASLVSVIKGTLFLKNKSFDNAMLNFNQAWLIDPQNPKAYLGMALVELSQNNTDSAKNLLIEGLSYDETNAQLRCNLSIVYIAKSGSAQDNATAGLYLSKAKQEVKKALTENPNDPTCKKVEALIGTN